MKVYRIKNRDSGEVFECEAACVDAAVEQSSWDPVVCDVEILPMGSRMVVAGTGTPRGKRGTRASKKAPEGLGAVPTTATEEAPASAPISKAETKPSRGRPRKEKAPGAEASGDGVKSGKGRPKKQMAEATAEATAEIATAQAGFKKQLEDEIAAAPVSKIVGLPTEAEQTAFEHKLNIEALAVKAEVMFLEMGRLLYEARENREWTILHFESFKDYVEDLKLPMQNSYSWATRLTNIYEYMVKQRNLNKEFLAQIGVAKLTRLLPLARKGELTDELIQKAAELSDLDLREELGHSVGGSDKPDMVICPRCGCQFDAKKASRP